MRNLIQREREQVSEISQGQTAASAEPGRKHSPVGSRNYAPTLYGMLPPGTLCRQCFGATEHKWHKVIIVQTGKK